MKKKLIISVDDLLVDDISRLFYASRTMASTFAGVARKFSPAVLMTAFFEASTRTRLSFEIAACRLGMQVCTFNVASSSMSKGESVLATISNLVAMSPDILVIRSPDQLELATLSLDQVAVINAGDGVNEHPSQAMLDCFTLVNYFKSDDLAQKRILIIGDVVHSRVAHSNIKLMSKLGAEVTLLAPEPFRMQASLGQRWSISDYEDCAGDYDAVMCLRIQKERMSQEGGFSDREFFEQYGLTNKRLERLGKNCVVLHPGPMNLGVEIEDQVAYGPRSLIRQQVKNGVLVRAALMEFCLSGG